MTGTWMPDLSQVGLNPSILPEDWGWATLNRDEEWAAGEPLARQPHYGEFVVAKYVTEHAACNQPFDQTRLVIATVSREMREDGRCFLHGQQWRKSLTPWAEAPHWWLFGPQGQEFFVFVEQCRSDARLWGKLDKDWSSPVSHSAMLLRAGLIRQQKWEVDELMGEARRTGAVNRALCRATETLYGYRTNSYDPNRAVTNDELAYCDGVSLNGVSSSFREEIGVVDNAIRWLILRDVMPPELYRLIAEPWHRAMGWPLHPADAF